jgi:2-keto-4-pentenoate hydratase/2-oxohepta-3-ene-1,7-dioic acid hydratase in catechol pathway
MRPRKARVSVNMKLANIESEGRSRVAIVLDHEIVDLTAQLGVDLDDVSKLLAMGREARDVAERCLKRATARVPVDSVKFLSPILRADKILGVGMNYHSFVAAAERIGVALPKVRLWFLRPRACIRGPYEEVWLPRGAKDLDYEAELAIIIGQRCRHVTAEDARAVVAGFTVANDLTLRDRVLKSIALGKCFDTHTPLGPWMVTADEIGDPHRLAVKTWVNGALRQNGNTDDMVAQCYELIEEISAVCTLNPGDIILTGTPDGSGLFCKPPQSLAADDLVKIEIEAIGAIENRVVNEPAVA